MDIKTFSSVAGALPPEMAVLMRGPTGIGKSFLAKALAEEKGVSVVPILVGF